MCVLVCRGRLICECICVFASLCVSVSLSVWVKRDREKLSAERWREKHKDKLRAKKRGEKRGELKRGCVGWQGYIKCVFHFFTDKLRGKSTFEKYTLSLRLKS